jgi:hypothetical protein
MPAIEKSQRDVLQNKKYWRASGRFASCVSHQTERGRGGVMKGAKPEEAAEPGARQAMMPRARVHAMLGLREVGFMGLLEVVKDWWVGVETCETLANPEARLSSRRCALSPISIQFLLARTLSQDGAMKQYKL